MEIVRTLNFLINLYLEIKVDSLLFSIVTFIWVLPEQEKMWGGT